MVRLAWSQLVQVDWSDLLGLRLLQMLWVALVGLGCLSLCYFLPFGLFRFVCWLSAPLPTCPPAAGSLSGTAIGSVRDDGAICICTLPIKYAHTSKHHLELPVLVDSPDCSVFPEASVPYAKATVNRQQAIVNRKRAKKQKKTIYAAIYTYI